MPQSGAARPEAAINRASQSAYSRWAPIYDLIFDLPFHPGRLAAAAAATTAAGRDGEVLVVGVGTGLELGLMPKSLRITGIDLSAPMLKIARERVAKHALGQVKGLHIMDAGALEFADAQFDVALAPYVMSVVPAPTSVLDEMWRVLRPGGQMVVMNHFPPNEARALASRRRWKSPPGGSAGIRNSRSPSSATGSLRGRTPSSWKDARSRHSGCSLCCGCARRMGARRGGRRLPMCRRSFLGLPRARPHHPPSPTAC
jgi:SAM-dependent methyltransferase